MNYTNLALPNIRCKTKFGESELDHGTRNLDGEAIATPILRCEFNTELRPMFIEASAAGANRLEQLIEKHHVFLSEELLSIDYGSCRLDPEGAWQSAVRVVAQVGAR